MTKLDIDMETAAKLEPEELGGKLLLLIKELMSNDGTYRPQHDELQIKSRSYLMDQTGMHIPNHIYSLYYRAFSEAWAWLEVNGLLVPDRNKDHGHGHVETGRRQLSRRALEFKEEVDISRYAMAKKLPKELLHRSIAEKVWLSFIRGDYDHSVFCAMREVEISVRKATGLPTIGVKLMRDAFNPENGLLSDPNAEAGEREGLASLFAGAIGSFKNPHSHRSVNLDSPEEAIEIVLFASHLLRIIDARVAALPAPNSVI